MPAPTDKLAVQTRNATVRLQRALDNLAAANRMIEEMPQGVRRPREMVRQPQNRGPRRRRPVTTGYAWDVRPGILVNRDPQLMPPTGHAGHVRTVREIWDRRRTP